MSPQIPKRSVSPFGTAPRIENDPLSDLDAAFAAAFGSPEGKPPRKFSSVTDAAHIPKMVRKAHDAPANDVPWLSDFCAYLVRLRPDFEAKNLAAAVYDAMEKVFAQKTELFLVDYRVVTEEEYAAKGQTKPEGPDEFRDDVLFSRERDALAGGFFAPWSDREPGLFSAFVDRWGKSENPDRVLHFLDFCAGAKNPTFEHYLLFTHPALARWASSKTELRGLLDRVGTVLLKLKSPTWEPVVRKSLGL